MKEFISNQREKKDLKEVKKVIPKKVIAFVFIALLVIIVIIGIVIYNHRFDVRNYITVSYVGANDYASPEFSVDKEGLKNALIGDKTDANVLSAINSLVNSIEVSSEATDLSNGDKFEINISYDKSYEEAAGVKLNLTKYSIRVEGVSSGTKISLFDNIEVTFQGISPEATVLITNNSEDEYLQSLTFEADKTTNISFGDTVIVSCKESYEDIARHGYLVDSLEASYTADKLGEYINGVEDIDINVINEIVEESKKAITTKTSDTTFRMLYKATANKDYLKQANVETASDIKLVSKYLLANGTNGSDYNNVLILIFSATISNESASETVYFAFSYYNSYITVDNQFSVIRSESNDNYDVSTSLESLQNSLINSQKERYTVYELNN